MLTSYPWFFDHCKWTFSRKRRPPGTTMSYTTGQCPTGSKAVGWLVTRATIYVFVCWGDLLACAEVGARGKEHLGGLMEGRRRDDVVHAFNSD